MDKYALLVGGVMFVAEGFLKFFGFRFLGMDMPCGASMIIVGFGLSLSAYKRVRIDKERTTR